MKPIAVIFGYIPFELDDLSELVEIRRHDFTPGSMTIGSGFCPDVFILAIDLDVLNGVAICRRLTQECRKAKAVILTDSYHATKYHNQLSRAGAHGFCLLSSGVQGLVDAVKSVL